MEVAELMNVNVQACGPDDKLNHATRIMWEGDCGAVPIVDANMAVVGIITDRDALMAAYTKGQRLDEIPIHNAMTLEVVTVSPRDALSHAEGLMQRHQIRRLPVTTDGQLVGMLSLGDIARYTRHSGPSDELSTERVAQTLAEISAPNTGPDSLAPSSYPGSVRRV